MDIRVTYNPPSSVSFYHHSYGNRSLHRLLSQTLSALCFTARTVGHIPNPLQLDANAPEDIRVPPLCLFGRAEELIAGWTGLWIFDVTWRTIWAFFSIAHFTFPSEPITRQLTEIWISRLHTHHFVSPLIV